MILSDREIRAALVRESMRITPDPRQNPDVWSSTALDLRLHEKLARWIFPPGAEPTFRPAEPDYSFQAVFQDFGQTVHHRSKTVAFHIRHV